MADQQQAEVWNVRERKSRELLKDVIVAALRDLEYPARPPRREGYYRLMQEIFPQLPRPMRARAGGFSMLLHQLRFSIAEGEDPPRSLWDLQKRLVAHILEVRRNRIMPIWDDRALACIDAAIETLQDRQQRILRALYYLDPQTNGKRETLDTLAAAFNLSRSRVGMIKNEAIRTLRQKSTMLGLDVLVLPVGDALQREFQRRAAEAKDREMLGPSSSLRDLARLERLKFPIHGLGLSMRTENGLCRPGLMDYVGELVQLTPRELLRIIGFGKTSLREVECRLAEPDMDLALGMNTDNRAVAVFNQIRDDLPKPKYP